MPEPNQKREEISARDQLMRDIRLRLAEGLIDIELDPEHYNHCIDFTLKKYRQLSSNSLEESYMFLELQPDQQEYVLPDEVIEIRKVFRRGYLGAGGQGTGIDIDPFDLAATNYYLLQAGRSLGLATYDFFFQFQETAGRLFGRDLNFKYDPYSKKLLLIRNVVQREIVMLWQYNFKPDEVLIRDVYSGPWMTDFATAQAKKILGAAYSKYSQIAGPQGGTTLNGDALKSEAEADIEKLELAIRNYETGEDPALLFVIG